MAPLRPIDPHTLAQTAALRSPEVPLPAPGVVCKGCGSDRILPVVVYDLIHERVEDSKPVKAVPVVLVCLSCTRHSVYFATLADEGVEGGVHGQ